MCANLLNCQAGSFFYLILTIFLRNEVEIFSNLDSPSA